MARTNTLDVLERIVRNLPIAGEIKYNFIDTEQGRIRFAYGQTADGIYHGVWAIDDSTGAPKICRPMEFAKDSTGDRVAKYLAKEAFDILLSLTKRDMTKAEWWDSKRTGNA